MISFLSWQVYFFAATNRFLQKDWRGYWPGSDSLEMVSYCPGMDGLRAQMEALQPDLLLVDLTAGVTFGVLSGLHEAVSHAKIILWVHSISTELALQQAMSLGSSRNPA